MTTDPSHPDYNAAARDAIMDLCPFHDPHHKCGIVREKVFKECLTELRERNKRSETLRQRQARRLEQRDKRIAGLERKVKRLEEALSWRTIDLESLSSNLKRTVQDALCNVRMIPVFGGRRDRVITEVRHTPTDPA